MRRASRLKGASSIVKCQRNLLHRVLWWRIDKTSLARGKLERQWACHSRVTGTTPRRFEERLGAASQFGFDKRQSLRQERALGVVSQR